MPQIVVGVVPMGIAGYLSSSVIRIGEAAAMPGATCY